MLVRVQDLLQSEAMLLCMAEQSLRHNTFDDRLQVPHDATSELL